MSRPRGTFVRNSPLARLNHWLTAGCFIALALSGLSMFHPALFFFSDLFGGGQWTRAVHPWIGLVLALSYAGLMVQFWRDNLPSWDDVAWMRAIGKVLVNEEEGVPEVPRFNAGQKFVFWSMALLVPVLLVTGIAIWEVYFFTYTSIEQQRIAVLVHSLAAVAAIIIWIVHVYAAIWVRGSMRAMTQGYVTPGMGVAAPSQMVARLGRERFLRAAPDPARAARVRQGQTPSNAAWKGNPLGGVVAPEAIVLPDPLTRFARTAARLEALSNGHPLGDWLRFMARLALCPAG